MNVATQSPIWRSAFTSSRNDEIKDQRSRLSQSLARMRENVGHLLTIVPADCKDLTVHDVSHLDALWEMAALITGVKFILNPAEVFVLGAAIYLHDAGLASVSYPGGLDELRATTEWQDISASTLRENKIEPTDSLISNPPSNLLATIKFSVLRALHAPQAQRMATERWSSSSGDVFLIEDQELRQAYGASIGRTAHSHNWSIEKVTFDLSDNIGSATGLPIDWSVNERKVACILRCADAAHIDRRRAPTMLHAALRPQGISDVHWVAQNKINKPTLDGSSLVYTAGQPFKTQEVDGWWLVYDLVNMIDNEIRTSNSLLEELRLGQFQVQRVAGAGSPRALSKHVRPEGWRPVNAEVKVSDPIHLALTLGGRSLYGSDVLAPIRELLQNSADAIRARREIESRDGDWGLIRISVERADTAEACWLHIDDNGIGMTERVLSGPLIDFGKSIWTSSILREEFPGLQSKNIKPIGKFGIGFFSVFDLALRVKVVSKRFNAGISDAKVLEFRSLNLRPLVREADIKELPNDFCTRVSLYIVDHNRITGNYRDPLHIDYRGFRVTPISVAKNLTRLVSMLDIRVEYTDQISGARFEHEPNVYESSPGIFIDELYPELSDRTRERLKMSHAAMLEVLTDGRTNYGRACLLQAPTFSDRDKMTPRAMISVGGFVYSRESAFRGPAIGVLEGSTDQAARRYATVNAPPKVIADWASSQARKVDQTKLLKGELMEIAEAVIEWEGDPGSLPYCFGAKGMMTLSQVQEEINNNSTMKVPLAIDYGQSFSVKGYDKVDATFHDLQLYSNVVVLRASGSELVDHEYGQRAVRAGSIEIAWDALKGNSGCLGLFLRIVERLWGERPRMSVEGSLLFQNETISILSPQWTLCLRRSK